ncbi:MAG: Arm DNA-binding domain-containing protein, partial [Acidobacteria bacterium]|nr:Arm DNA-binding domain-containing protein [Acidobacteriota bacterium]
MPDRTQLPLLERPYRLSARFVEAIQHPGRYGDGRGSGGLSLRVKRTARGHLSKTWGQRINVDGQARNLGLGSWPHVSLAEARQQCALNLLARQRGELLTGHRPTVPTFGEAVEKV